MKQRLSDAGTAIPESPLCMNTVFTRPAASYEKLTWAGPGGRVVEVVIFENDSCFNRERVAAGVLLLFFSQPVKKSNPHIDKSTVFLISALFRQR